MLAFAARGHDSVHTPEQAGGMQASLWLLHPETTQRTPTARESRGAAWCPCRPLGQDFPVVVHAPEGQKGGGGWQCRWEKGRGQTVAPSSVSAFQCCAPETGQTSALGWDSSPTSSKRTTFGFSSSLKQAITYMCGVINVYI